MMRKFGPLTNSNGISILAVLAATAVMGVLTMTVASLTGTMSAQSKRARQVDSVDVFTEQIKAALNHPALCDGSLRNLLGTTLVWANPLLRVEILSIRVGGQIILSKGQCIDGTVCLGSMYLRKLTPGTPAVPWIAPTGSYSAYSSVIELRFNFAGAPNSREAMGGNVQPRLIPLNVAVRAPPGARTVDYCNQNFQSRIFNKVCPSAASPANPACGALPGGADTGKCVEFYYVSGFDVFSQPQCRCRIVCHTL